MKIVEQTVDRMVLRQKPTAVVFLMLWGSLFAGMPLLMIINLIISAGVVHLSCQRVAPAQVDCVSHRSHWFGLIPGEKTSIQQVTSAQLLTETRSGEDGEYEVYGVKLISPQTSTIVYDFNDYGAKQEWVNQINQFIQSSQSQLTLTYDMRWDGEQRIAPILFMSLFVGVGFVVLYSTLRVRILILDKSLNRLTYRVHTLLGPRGYDYPLGSITAVNLKEHTDSYGNKYYEPILLPDPVKRVTLAYIHNRQEALQLQAQVREFLKLSPQSDLLEAGNGIKVYERQDRTYTSSQLDAIPVTAPAKVQQIDRQLDRLGFSFVGDLQVSNFSTANFYGYAHSSKDVYAVILTAGTADPLWIGLDFYTSFFNGVLLTTTSHYLVIKHLKPQKLWRWSYPNLDVAQLYQQHQHHWVELQAQAGRSYRTKADLAAIAAVMDDYMSRQTSGLLPTLATIVNAAAMASTASRTTVNSDREQNKIR